MNKAKCKECGSYTDILVIFSKGECLKCHEKAFQFDDNNPDFVGAINV